jgi:hypothetical protein
LTDTIPSYIKWALFDWISVGHFLLERVKTLHAPAAKRRSMRVPHPDAQTDQRRRRIS